MKTFIVNKDGSTGIIEIPKPRFSSKQALVKMIACGMCGSDVKFLHRTFKGFPESMYPVMLGHEGVGEVVEVGSDVVTFNIGDRVMLPFVDMDTERYGNLGSAWGALSEYGIVNDPKAWQGEDAPDCAYAQTVLDPSIDPVDAIMIVTFREVLSNIRYFDVKPGDSIVVVGCGPVGQTFIKILSLTGVKDIIAVETNSARLSEAKENGASILINAKNQDVEKEIRSIFNNGVDYVLDAVGSSAIINQYLPVLKDRGSILAYGVPEKEEMMINFSRASYNWKLIFQQMPRKKAEGAANEQIVEWIKSGKLVLSDFISDYFSFENASAAYKKMLAGEILKKGVIKFNY